MSATHSTRDAGDAGLSSLRRRRAEHVANYRSHLGIESPEAIAAARHERTIIDAIDEQIEAATRTFGRVTSIIEKRTK